MCFFKQSNTIGLLLDYVMISFIVIHLKHSYCLLQLTFHGGSAEAQSNCSLKTTFIMNPSHNDNRCAVAVPYNSNSNRSSNMNATNLPSSIFKTDGREKFELDINCRPCQTLEEAISWMHTFRGGFDINSRSFLRAETTKKSKKGGTVVNIRIYHCTGWSGNGTKDKCKVRTQIREFVSGGHCPTVFAVYRHKFHNRHSHALMPEAPNPCRSYGIHPYLLNLVANVINGNLDAQNHSTILRMKASRIMSEVIGLLRSHHHNPEMQSHWKRICSNSTYKEHLYSQVKSYLYWKKESFISKTLGGLGRTVNNDNLLRVLSLWKLELPVGYMPRDTYASAKEIAVTSPVVGRS